MQEQAIKNMLENVLPFFYTSLSESKVTRLGNGLINLTFLVEQKSHRFVIQRINKNVFKHPSLVIENTERICKHLLDKQQKGLYRLASIEQIISSNGSAEVLVDGEYWRATKFIADCETKELITTSAQAQQVAATFAEFSDTLSDFPADTLVDIIPNFHDISTRLSQLSIAIKQDKVQRVKQAQLLIKQCLEQQDLISAINALTPKLPKHVTHNDTKINNLLFSHHSQKPLAVIDLDTCMPGYLMHDFGDMVRTCCSSLPEDADNINDMVIKWDILTGLVQGYLGYLEGKITGLEKQSLVLGILVLPFMLSVRFLTDYLNGDTYFHTNYPEHNLVRAKNQFAYFALLKGSQDKITQLVMQNYSSLQAESA